MKSLRHLAFAILTAGIGSALAVVGFPSVASAAIYTWTGGASDGTGSNNWFTSSSPPPTLTSNWTPSGSLVAADTIVFGTAPANRLTPIQNQSVTVGNLIFNDSAPAYTIGTAGTQSLTITGGLTNQSANMQTITGSAVGAALVLSGAVVDTGSSGITFSGRTFNATTGNFTKTGSGLLQLTNVRANSYTGTATISSGSVSFAPDANNPSFNGTLVLQSGATGTSASTGFQHVSVESGATMSFTGGSVFSLTTGTQSTVRLSGGSVTSGTIGGTLDVVGNPSVTTLVLGGSATTVIGFTANDQSSLAGGSITHGGNLQFNFDDVTSPDLNKTWQMFDYTSKSGSFAGVTLTSTNTDYLSISGSAWRLAENGNQFETGYGAGVWLSDWTTGGQRFIFSQNTGVLTIVPEPSTIVFAGIGVAMLGWHTWTRSRRRARMKALEDHVRRGDGVPGRA